MNINKYFLPILFCLLISACDIINPAESIPAYIHIEAFEKHTDEDDEGSDSHAIVDAWVFSGSDFLGNYSLPATFPVLQEGVQDLIIFPGINDNGIGATPSLHRLYERYDVQVDLDPNVTDTLRPVTSYVASAKFTFLEDFNDNNQQFIERIGGDSSAIIQVTTDNAFETGSGRIILTEARPTIEVGSPRFSVFPQVNLSTYVELDFKTEVDVAMYIRAFNTFDEVIYRDQLLHIAAASEDWRKIYFNFGDSFNIMQILDPSSYQIVFLSTLPLEDGEFIVDRAEIMIDNIKFVHF